ncbi:signal peptidase I [Hydrogenispora ethanolica]|jgi:signal peptidase I|uniref:Signal peptidase I n=1 Tax=Hydrogenispora ethanolica TaxID=1082276 RepID=A0A4R1QST9_HYDET|nr:signal peptidase I [Hydrogenispora ethanolica]TCL53914.1 signal peptidase I [Hydrogenispora ethanolica]
MLGIQKSEYRENIEAFAIAVLTILFIIIFVMQSFLVKGTSMEPTLRDGERLLVNKFIFQMRIPKTGDIIVLKYPKDPTKKFIKRVIAGPGQTVYVQDSKLYVDGTELDEKYIKEKTFSNYDFQVVPEGTVFVMGDNRNGSKDSRDPDVGFVPLKNVVGKAFFIFWPPQKIQVLSIPKYKNKIAQYPQ